MAKGQKRSTREIRKPKKDKGPPKPESSFANQIKTPSITNTPRSKGKG